MSKTVEIVVLEWNLQNSEFYASVGFDQFMLSKQDFSDYFNNIDDSESVHPTDYGKLGADFFDFMRKGEERTGVNIRLKMIDGKYYWCAFESHYVKNEKDKIIKGICTISIYHENEKCENDIYDSLTGLYNRDTFCKVMYEMIQKDKNKKYALIQWDMGRFRVYNDMFGYEEGDNLLKYMANKMKEYIGKSGECSRVFADHFYACIPNEEKYVEKFIDEMKLNLKDYRKDFEILPYFAVYPINNPMESKQKMCNNVRLTMIEAKSSINGNVAFFDKKTIDKTLTEQEIINGVKEALENDEFVVYYQPKFCLTSGDVVGAEALVRWNHPQKGLILPGEFIKIIEMTGFIIDMDKYVWESVCKQLKEWREKGYPILPVSVNISRSHLYNPDLLQDLLNLIKKYSLESSLIEIEIDESFYSIDPDQLVSVTRKIEENGFKISMDNFGTGYASFNMLNNLPVDIIKIDKEFVDKINHKNEQGKNVLKTVMKLADMVGIPVVAEGVETEEHVEFLRGIRCNYAQGFYFSKAITPEHYEDIYLLNRYARLIDDTEIFKQSDIDEYWDPGVMIELMYNNIVASMGIFEFKDDEIKVLRANNGYFKIMQCDLKTFKNDDKNIWNRIIEKDRVTAIQRVSVAIESKCITSFDFRAVSPDNIISVYSAKILYLSGDKYNFMFYGALKDITVEKEIKNKLKAKEEGYKILFENSNLITFDYDVENDKLIYALKLPEKAYVEKVIENFLEKRAKIEHVHADYQKEYLDLFEWASNKAIKGEFDYLANYLGYGYSWCRAYYVSVTDDDGVVYRIVGQVLDIQHEKDDLNISIHSSNKDQMTGILNKTETRNLIQKHLLSKDDLEQDVLLLMDLDDFKKVNDNYGHIIGDLVIKKIAMVLEKVFSIQDIVGRFGGDEFIVFLKNIPRDILEEKIKTFYEMFKLEQSDGKIEIGCSIGIAYTSDAARDFDTLIEHADIAMFEAKEQGKNHHRYYEDL